MTFAQIPAGTAIFVDANTLVYHFTADPKYGPACTQLVKRIELQQLRGFTSAQVLANVAHRLMTIEAMQRLNWPPTRLAARLRKSHAEIPNLSLYRQAVASVPQLQIQVFPITQALVETATRRPRWRWSRRIFNNRS